MSTKVEGGSAQIVFRKTRGHTARRVSVTPGKLLAKNVEAGRLVAGFTISEPGNWTTWPPHEYAKMLEEMSGYFDMPDPAFWRSTCV